MNLTFLTVPGKNGTDSTLARVLSPDSGRLLVAGVVGQQALLPQHSDPKLWLVHTKPGAEREAVQCLLQKGVDLALRGVPLQIKSAFTQDHLKARPGWRSSLGLWGACTLCVCTWSASVY